MKIDVYTIMHNEAPILPYFLRHYETVADRIFVFEDQSTDGTREILQSHPKVTLLHVDKPGVDDVYWVNELWPHYKLLSRGQADWCMCVDADEFVYHPRLREFLEEKRAGGVQFLRCEGWAMLSETFPTTPGQIYEEINTGVYDKSSSKWVVFDPSIDILFACGRHRGPREISPNTVMQFRTGLMILHYRYLGHRYFVDRVARNQQRHVYDRIRNTTRKIHNLPDGTRGPLIEWWDAALKRAQVCVPTR
jgi:glycosyltransferase involved in cell wall biosynthesis